jgi:hypothetical protein
MQHFFAFGLISAQGDIKIQDKYTAHNRENSLFLGRK